jgi:hypothetical protein
MVPDLPRAEADSVGARGPAEIPGHGGARYRLRHEQGFAASAPRHAESTLIVYKGKTEVGRSTGDTDMMSIEALLDKAI